MFLFAAAILVGVCVVHAAPELPSAFWVIVPVSVAGIAILFRKRHGAICIFAVCIGVVWAWSHAALRMGEALPSDAVQIDAEVVGYVSSLIGGDGQDLRFALDIVESDPRLPPHVELTWYDADVHPAPGELWRLRVRVRPPRGFSNPGGSDFSAALLRKHVGATGYVRQTEKGDGDNARLSPPSWRYSILRMRMKIASRIERALGDSAHVGIVQGLAVGDTHHIAPEQWRVFSTTGTTHLMAISGLHVGMVAALIAWFGGCVGRRLPLQIARIAVSDVQSICGMTGAIMYGALAGFSVPTQRALVMLLVYFGTRISRRHVGVTHGLGLALLGVLLIDPFAPLAPGFWLSFGAVSAIFLTTAGQLSQPSWVRNYVQLQAAVSIGMLPLLIGAFGTVSLISPIVNLAAIPIYTFIVVPTVLVGAAASFANEWLGTWILQLSAQQLDWTWPLLDHASRAPLALWHFPQLPWWLAMLFALGCVVLIAPGMSVTRLAGAMLCLPAITWQPQRPNTGDFDLAVLDVGQGLAVVVLTSSHILVYDAGPSFRSGRDTGEMVVLPYLRSRGVNKIDVLMVSHGDDDHAGGAGSVLAGLPTLQLLVGPSVDKEFSKANACHLGQRWDWDGVSFEVLHPPRGAAGKDNDLSCVLRIAGNGGSAILLGDIEGAAEGELSLTGMAQRADIVLVPHHGSRTSSSETLVQALAPSLAIVSAGFGNRWGFPKSDVVERWQSVGARTMNTARSGAIEIKVTVDGPQTPREYRDSHKAYWRP